MPTVINNRPSPETFPISMQSLYNRIGSQLTLADLGDESLLGRDYALVGENVVRGVRFELGEGETPNLLLLRDEPVTLQFDRPIQASYFIILHTAVPKQIPPDPDGITRPARGRELLGDKVADYELIFEEQSCHMTPIRRRFAIGEITKQWGDECFECVSVAKQTGIPTVTERMAAGRPVDATFGRSQTRIGGDSPGLPGNLWVYALPNPNPEQPVQVIRFIPNDATVLIFGLSATRLDTNPLRWEARRKARLLLPEGVIVDQPDRHGAYPELGIDLGQIISALPRLDYDHTHWEESYNNKAGTPVENEVIVEYTAHPAARFFLGEGNDLTVPVCELSEEIPGGYALTPIHPADQWVRLRVIDAASRLPVAVKLHIHGEWGEYLPPVNRHRIPNPFWYEDYSVDFLANGTHWCTYVDGDAQVKLPLGNCYIEVSKGLEIRPVRRKVEVTADTREVTIELERVLPWRERGWVTADTHVHFLSPNSALLEGAGEGVNVVNLLASQWGELFTNAGDFDGRTNHGAKEFGGDGEYIVRVGTENRQHVLGHISLCGYDGPMITPLTTGGPDESALGDAIEVTLTQWAEQCRAQKGVVVLPHFPNPRCENAASLVLGVIDAVEMTSWGNLYAGIDPYSLSDWYRYLNCGYFVAAVGGTDKMSAQTAVGTVRTYAQIAEGEFTYERWREAVRAGRTFATYGPLMEFTLEGQPMGSRLELPRTGGTLQAEWRLATVTLPISKVELVVNGETREVVTVEPGQKEISGSFSVPVERSGWVALRVRGGYADKRECIAAHSSPTMVEVEGRPCFAAADAMTILEQIEGTIAFIDTIGTRAKTEAYKAARMRLTSAHRALHNKMHQAGAYHAHSPADEHAHPDHA